MTALKPPSDDVTWDLVVNCAAETKLAQSDAVYKEGTLTLSLNCVKECARLGVKKYIEISSGCMYSNDKVKFIRHLGFRFKINHLFRNCIAKMDLSNRGLRMQNGRVKSRRK
jgi:hypothetical protein